MLRISYPSAKAADVRLGHGLEEHQRRDRRQTLPWQVSCLLISLPIDVTAVCFFYSLLAARSSRTISDRSITHIVSVCEDVIPAHSPASNIQFLVINVPDVDHADLLIQFPRACQFIHRALTEGGVVLVHCSQGLSRSATVVAAYVSPCFYPSAYLIYCEFES
jgi:hypothetical protein